MDNVKAISYGQARTKALLLRLHTDRLDRILKSNGRQRYKIKQDGNCFMNAVLHQMPDVNQTCQELRADTCEHLEQKQCWIPEERWTLGQQNHGLHTTCYCQFITGVYNSIHQQIGITIQRSYTNSRPQRHTFTGLEHYDSCVPFHACQHTTDGEQHGHHSDSDNDVNER